MKRTLCAILALIITGGMLMTSCGNTENESSAESAGENTQSLASSAEESATPGAGSDIALGCPYFYECGSVIKGDTYVTALTDGRTDAFVTLTPSLDKKGTGYSIDATDWNGQAKQIAVDNSYAAISVDLGFMSETESFALALEDYTGEAAEVYYSTDGYNFSFYAGALGTYADGELKGELKISAKAVMFMLPFTAEKQIKISEIKISGSRNRERELLSLGASYDADLTEKKQYGDDGTKLTDGKTAFDVGEEAVVSRSASAKDARTGKSGNEINLDLGIVKNVSEVSFGFYYPKNQNIDHPDRVTVRYSVDGEKWYDLGQSFLRTAVNERGGASKRYFVTRNHTVEARYIKILTFTSTVFMTDEISVYGSSSPVAEPDYDFINRKNQISNSNVAAFEKCTLNGKKWDLLTDLLYGEGVKSVTGENKVRFTLASKTSLCGAALTFKDGEINNVTVSCGAETAANVTVYPASAGSGTTYYVYFDPIEGSELTVGFTSEKSVTLCEASAYAGQPQLPLVRGGFFQLSTAGDNGFYSAGSDAYSWYLQLKAMKDLGMEYVVIQYSTHYNAKSTLINGKNITAAGYKYANDYGVEDVCGAVLDAADKLGMKVWLGTIHDSDFNSPVANTETYKKIVADGKLVIKDIYDMYSSHPSFAGYYLSDEECDQWLNMNGGVAAARLVYGGQSEYIRSLDPDLKIMIAPAIWRSGKAETGADNLYKAIRAESEGERPIVDIVAAQDCLGRLASLTVDAGTYDAYDSYCAEWAKAVRRAGAEFWHDAEVFEVTGTTKRYGEVVRSLGIEAKHSGSVIVFDIPHYFTLFPTASFDNVKQYYLRRNMLEYAKYYSGLAAIDRIGEDADIPAVRTDDGKVIEEASNNADAKIYGVQYNPGVIVQGTPLSDGGNAEWHDFKAGNGKAKPEFAYFADSDAFYVLVNTHDETSDFANGTWWTGEDDLVQIWMVSTGETQSVATDSDHGIRFWIHRTASGWQKGGTAGGKISLDQFEFTEKDGLFIIKMPWKALGINPPSAGSGAAMGIVIQYIDGSDLSWAASQGSKGQAVDNNALYSY